MTSMDYAVIHEVEVQEPQVPDRVWDSVPDVPSNPFSASRCFNKVSELE